MADVISVSALNTYVRSLLESNEVLTDIAIQGEISNYSRNHKSGHCYFTLKDEKASVKAVMFRTDAEGLSFTPENGMGVVVRGRISLYERDGAFQIYVEYMFPDGVGAAMLAFEQLKEKLGREGLFDPEHKQMLPAFPACVGLVTSKTGAALQDILNIARRRCPNVHFVLAPVLVQGAQAPGDIAKGIARLDTLDEVELIIVARGGGSAEDLWAFNAEQVARAAWACETPLVSAIGHETDFTILDFVADLRAPTPSAAAEIALPDLADIYAQMLNVYAKISNDIHRKLDSCYNGLHRQVQHPAVADMAMRCAEERMALRVLYDGIQAKMAARAQGASARMQNALGLAAALNPYQALARGYSVTKAGGRVLASVVDAAEGQVLDVILKDGRLACMVQSIHKEQADLE